MMIAMPHCTKRTIHSILCNGYVLIFGRGIQVEGWLARGFRSNNQKTFSFIHTSSSYETKNYNIHNANIRGVIQQKRLASSSGGIDFQPPTPPGTRGIPIYPDIDLNVSSSSALQRNNDPNAVFVVTGASRGIGLQFIRSLMERTKGTIIACCRSPSTANNLNEYIDSLRNDDDDGSNSSRIQILPLDLEDQKSIEHVASLIQKQYTRIDLLLNVAGLLGDGGVSTPGPERSITKMDRSWFEKTMAVNVIGPVMLTKELSSLLQCPKQRSKASTVNNETDGPTQQLQNVRQQSIVVNLSARVGSITDNELGGWYSYRISKAALNQATRTIALEMKRHNVLIISLHPGTTDTDLSKPFQKNVKDGTLFPVTFTVNQLLNAIDAVEDKNTGGFYDWAGKAISF